MVKVDTVDDSFQLYPQSDRRRQRRRGHSGPGLGCTGGAGPRLWRCCTPERLRWPANSGFFARPAARGYALKEALPCGRRGPEQAFARVGEQPYVHLCDVALGRLCVGVLAFMLNGCGEAQWLDLISGKTLACNSFPLSPHRRSTTTRVAGTGRRRLSACRSRDPGRAGDDDSPRQCVGYGCPTAGLYRGAAQAVRSPLHGADAA